MVLCISFGFVYLISSFLQGALDEDVWHVSVFLKLRDVQVTFGIFFYVLCKELPICYVIPPLLIFEH
jgi:hypothetical protein